MHPKVIAAAIRNKRLLAFHYHGCPRLVEPHIYGVSRQGTELLSAYQIGGRSRHGNLGWKLFHVDDITALHLGEQEFACARPDYNPADDSFAAVVLRL